MSTNLINQIRELSKQLAHARSVWGDEDERTWDNSREGIMKTVFKDGKMTLEYTLKEIRDKLHNGGF